MRIKAAAIRNGDGAVFSLPAPNRHHHIIGAWLDKVTSADEQGFLTNEDKFVGRVEAKRIAKSAGQLLPDASTLPRLYSEDVW